MDDLKKKYGTIPPNDVLLEQAILGALMLERDALSSVIDILKPGCFYNISHQNIYRAIEEIFKDSKPVDILTVKNQMSKNGTLEAIGGVKYLAELTLPVNSTANIESYARIINELSIKRELIQNSFEVQNNAYEPSTDAFDLLDKTQQTLYEISQSYIRKNFETMSTLMQKALIELEAKKNRKDGLTGVPSGFIELDRTTSGWQKSDLVIIASRPGMGKTAFAVSAMRNASIEYQKPIAFFSLEMSSIQLVNRLISAESEIESEKIRKGTLSEREWEQLISKTDALSSAPIYIDDTPALSVMELRAKARRMKTKYDIQLVIIDYLQLMQGETHKNTGGGNREQEIAFISRSLKKLAKELDIPVIALSQLSREVEKRGGDKRPQLSDLRESGSIEQDADMVIFIYRPEYYGLNQTADGSPSINTGEIIIAKHRNGSLKDVQLRYIGKYTKFSNLEYASSSSEDKARIIIPSKINKGHKNTSDESTENPPPPF